MTNNSSGLGFSSILTLIFIVLKLIGIINWSWWWVLSPIFINVAILLIIAIIGLIIALILGR